MPGRNRPSPCSSFLMDSGVAQQKIPELPPLRRCRHCATNSKLVTIFVERVTPTGLPVQNVIPFVHVHVFVSQLTLMKSSLPNARQPVPVPSMKALGSGTDSCAPALRRQRQRRVAPGKSSLVFIDRKSCDWLVAIL